MNKEKVWGKFFLTYCLSKINLLTDTSIVRYHVYRTWISNDNVRRIEKKNKTKMNELETEVSKNQEKMEELVKKSEANTKSLMKNKENIHKRRESIMTNREKLLKNRSKILIKSNLRPYF